MSWIHRDDLVRLIVHIIANPDLCGPVNATAPEPVRNEAFTTALAHALRRPAVLLVPAWPLRLMLGGFAEELLLGGQKVMPRAAVLSGFRFLYPSIAGALGQIVGNSRQDPERRCGRTAAAERHHAGDVLGAGATAGLLDAVAPLGGAVHAGDAGLAPAGDSRG
jgi:hypothetical protein